MCTPIWNLVTLNPENLSRHRLSIMPDTNRKAIRAVASKHAYSPSHSAPFSSKRQRSDENQPQSIPKKPRITKEIKPVVTQKLRPPFNPIHNIPDHLRPAPRMFVWGTGNFGQFGMGTDFLGEFDIPTRNKLIEEKISKGAFGGEGAGIESVASGGLHTLFTDEEGKVCVPCLPYTRILIYFRSGLVAPMTMLPWDA
jgi:regulator of chromosome condensation